MAEFRTMQKLMIKAQDKAKEIRHLQDTVLPKLKQQLADTKGIFKGKERKALTEQIQRAEKEIAERLDKLHPKSRSIFSSGFFRASGAGQVMNNCYPPLTDRRRSALKGL